MTSEALLATQHQLHSARSARDNAKLAVTRSKAKLETQTNHSKEFYSTLYVETHEVSWTQAAKADAEAFAAESQETMHAM